MSWQGVQVINVAEHTTRNARRMKWYTLTWGDATTTALTFKDGVYYLDGVRVEDPSLVEHIKLAIIQSQPLKMPNVHKYTAPRDSGPRD